MHDSMLRDLHPQETLAALEVVWSGSSRDEPQPIQTQTVLPDYSALNDPGNQAGSGAARVARSRAHVLSAVTGEWQDIAEIQATLGFGRQYVYERLRELMLEGRVERRASEDRRGSKPGPWYRRKAANDAEV